MGGVALVQPARFAGLGTELGQPIARIAQALGGERVGC